MNPQINEKEVIFRRIIKTLSDIYFIITLDSTVLDYNINEEKVYFPKKRLLGEKLIKLFPKDIHSQLEEEIKNVYDNDEFIIKEHVLNLDGDQRYFEFLYLYLGNEQIALFIKEISKQKITENRLSESVKKYRSIIENIKEGYFEVDLEGNFTFFNDGLQEMLGYSHDEMIGMNFRKYMIEKNAKRTFEVFNKVYRTGETYKNFQYEIINKNGKILHGESSVYLRYDSFNKKIGFNGFIRDVSEKIEAEQKLKESEERYKEAFNRANFYKDILTHDINNILHNISSAQELSLIVLENPERANEIKEYLGIIKSQITRADKLVSNVRRLSEIEQFEITIKKIDLRHVLYDALKYIKESYQNRNINIHFDDIKQPIFIQANELLLDVFENILTNSVRHNNNQVIEIYINISEEQSNGRKFIKFQFKDNGNGIPDDQKKILFQTVIKKNGLGRGMGIGLSLVNKVIVGYKGKIWVEDRIIGDYTKGANFVLLIPKEA